MTRHFLLPIALVLLHAAPAAALQNSSCFPRNERPGEHGFGTFFDSAAVAGVIEREWEPEWGILFASLATDTTGAEGRLRLYSTSAEQEDVERIAQWLLAFRNTTPVSDSTSVVLMLAEGDEIRPRSITGFAQCGPRIRDVDAVQARLVATTRQPTVRNSQAYRSSRDVQTVIWAWVETNGRISEYQIHESSGFPEWDRIASQVAVGIEFEPATREGIPVGVWVQIPFKLNKASGGRRTPSLGWWAGGNRGGPPR